jgi:hypothetical protein
MLRSESGDLCAGHFLPRGSPNPRSLFAWFDIALIFLSHFFRKVTARFPHGIDHTWQVRDALVPKD